MTRRYAKNIFFSLTQNSTALVAGDIREIFLYLQNIDVQLILMIIQKHLMYESVF